MMLVQLCEVINDYSDNFGVNVNIIDIGIVVGGVKFVFIFIIIGVGNDFKIVNDGDWVEFDKLIIIDFIEIVMYLSVVKLVVNVKVIIDGIVVESEINNFENII